MKVYLHGKGDYQWFLGKEKLNFLGQNFLLYNQTRTCVFSLWPNDSKIPIVPWICFML